MMEKNNESLEKVLSTLSGLEEKLSFIADVEEKVQTTADDLSGKIDDLFTLERELEQRLDALNALVTDVNNAIHRADELKEAVEATLPRLEKLDIQGLRNSLEDASETMAKTEKALLSEAKKSQNKKDKLRPNSK